MGVQLMICPDQDAEKLVNVLVYFDLICEHYSSIHECEIIIVLDQRSLTPWDGAFEQVL